MLLSAAYLWCSAFSSCVSDAQALGSFTTNYFKSYLAGTGSLVGSLTGSLSGAGVSNGDGTSTSFSGFPISAIS